MRSSAAQCRSGAPTPITMLSLRDLGAAIVTAAGCGAWWGVGKFSAWLSASTPASLAGVTLARWQWVNVAAFAVNVVSVAIPGRIDDEMATQMKKEAKIRKSPRSVASGVPKDSIYRSLVTPAGWAFLIWPVIYLAESVFTAAQASSSLDQISAAAYASAAPWWALSCTLQALWCVAFRDWAKAPSHFWISGSLLVAESVSLGKAVAAMDAAKVAFPSAAYLCGRLPLALHHGWITAAAVVNVNSWIAVSENYPSQDEQRGVSGAIRVYIARGGGVCRMPRLVELKGPDVRGGHRVGAVRHRGGRRLEEEEHRGTVRGEAAAGHCRQRFVLRSGDGDALRVPGGQADGGPLFARCDGVV